jgi:outer membrane receptor protein involved in Fe transport
MALSVACLSDPAPAFAQAASDGVSEAASSASAGGRVEEIFVTAQRRSERVIDVPYNISAVAADTLSGAGAMNANDLTKVVAGLGFSQDGPADRLGENNFSMRGLRTDPVGQSLSPRGSVSSVSTYFGDAPVFFPIMLTDIERVEVLRGPQGTLYGSGAQGGTIRFIPNRPSFDSFGGNISGSFGATEESDDFNSGFEGALNVPLAENLALRVSGAHRSQAGFIDQVNLFQLDANGVPVPSVRGDLTSGPVIAPVKDTNSWDQWMARAALRYEPTDWLNLQLDYMLQRIDSDDAQTVNPNYAGGLRDLSDGTYPNAPYRTRPGGNYKNTQPTLQPTENQLDLATATIVADLGFAEITSVTSWYQNQTSSINEGSVVYISPFFNWNSGYSYYPRFTIPIPNKIDESGWTQELRLVSQNDSPLSYVVGAYYSSYEKGIDFAFRSPGLSAFTDFVGAPSANPEFVDTPLIGERDYDTTERAIFGELSYQITEPWQVTVGARSFNQKQSSFSFDRYPYSGINMGGPPFVNSGSVSDTVYKVNTSFDLTPDTLIYFTRAEGFRRGGTNPFPSEGPQASLPEIILFRPDFATNYELGIKGAALDGAFTYSAAIYRIDLDGFQFNSNTPNGYGGVFNGSKAQTKGVELEGRFSVTPQLTMFAGYTYTEAEAVEETVIRDLAIRALDDGFQESDIIVNPRATVAKGSTLPGVPRHTATAAVDYGIPLGGGNTLILHANANYRSEQNNNISEAPPNFAVLPSAFFADASITFASGQNWAATLSVSNLTNETGFSGTNGAQDANTQLQEALLFAGKTVAMPRTTSLNLRYEF